MEGLFSEVNVLEILKRAKGKADGEVVPWNEGESNVREEVNRRAAKAGYCNSDGSPVSSGRIISKPLSKEGRENYVKIFGHK